MIRIFSSFSVTVITCMRRSSSSGVWSPPVVCRRDSTSEACFLFLCKTTSKFVFGQSRSATCESLVLSVRFSIQFRESWSVLMVNLVFSRYECNRSTTHTIKIHSLCMVPYRHFTQESDLDQYHIVFTFLSGSSCARMQPTSLSRASVSSARLPVGLEARG